MKKTAIACAAFISVLLIFGPVPGSAKRPVRPSAWSQIGPMGGNIASLARNPKSSGEIYAVTLHGLVFRSADNGGKWARKSALDADYSYFDIALDPKNPKTVYVLGQNALHKSVDAGVTFKKLPLEFKSDLSSIDGKIIIHPLTPATIFVSGSAAYAKNPMKWCMAVFKSTNGGQTWTQKLLETTSNSSRVSDIVISSKTPSKMYLCGSISNSAGNQARVYRSTNGGAGWTNVTPAFMNPDTYSQAMGIAVDPSNPARVFVSYVSGLARSADSGNSWQKQAAPESLYGLKTIAVDKANPRVLCGAGVKAFFRSSDGGKNWTQFLDAFWGQASKILASSDTIHIASSAGIFKSTDTGLNFFSAHAGIPATDVADFLILDPASRTSGASASTAYAAIANYGVFLSANGGKSWTILPAFDGCENVGPLAASAADPGRVYASTYGGVYGSVDGGNTFTLLLAATQRYTLLLDPANPKRIIAAGFLEISGTRTMGIFRSTDGGVNWTQVKIREESGSGADAGALDPSDGNTIYLSGHKANRDPVLYRSKDGGVRWTELAVPTPPSSWSLSQISALAVDPKSPNRIYAGTEYSGVYVSTNGGGAWTMLGENAPASANSVAINASNPNEVFVGSSDGLFYSLDKGTTWKELWRDLPNKNVTSIHVDGAARKVYVGTRGGGICRRSF